MADWRGLLLEPEELKQSDSLTDWFDLIAERLLNGTRLLVGGEALGGPRADAAGGPGNDRDSLWHNVCFPFLSPTCGRRTPVFLRHYSERYRRRNR